MAGTRTAADLLAAKREKMPADLADLHFQLGQDLTWLNLNWQEFKKLFAINDKRFALMNVTAPRFFARFEQTVWHDTLLHLCRLTDPPQSVGKDNLTIRRLTTLITDLALAARVTLEVEDAVLNTEFARDWRNRRLAHRDLAHVLEPQLYPLAPASRADVEKALASLSTVMNSVELHYENATTSYEHVIVSDSGAEALLYYLSSGLEADEARKKEGQRWAPVHY
jgi:AbiU2